LAGVIEKKFGVTPTLIKSGGGAFEVTANDELVFSKLAVGRFPEDEEIISALSDLET